MKPKPSYCMQTLSATVVDLEPGRADLAQAGGSGAEKIEEAFEAARRYLKSELGEN